MVINYKLLGGIIVKKGVLCSLLASMLLISSAFTSNIQAKEVLDSEVVAEKLAIQQNVPKVIEYLTVHEKENYSGLYQDSDEIVILFKKTPNDTLRREIKDMLGKGVKLTFKESEYSEGEINRYVEVLYENIDKEKSGVLSISTSIKDQKIQIGLAEESGKPKLLSNETQISMLAENHNIPQELLRFETQKSPEPLVDRASIKVRPVNAGVMINFEGKGFCTNGYSAKDSSGNHYLVSAGHCSDEIGQTVNQSYKNDNKIGKVYENAFSYGTKADALSIKVKSSMTTPWIYTTNRVNDYNIVGQQIADWEGMEICTSLGNTDKELCGWVKSTNWSGFVGGLTWLKNQKTLSIDVADVGDSGSPVFTFGAKKNVAIYGIISATDGKVTVMSHVKNINSELGIKPILGKEQ